MWDSIEKCANRNVWMFSSEILILHSL